MALSGTLLVEVGLNGDTSTALSGITWTDITAYVRGGTTNRGRPNELSGVEAGTSTAKLLNTDRRFDPLNTVGPYWPNIRPMNRWRVSFVYNSITYRLFTGYVERWPQAWEISKYGESEVTAVDGFELLRQADVDLTTLTAFTGTLTLAAQDVTGLSSTATMQVGDTVTGVGVVAGTTVQAITSSTAVTLSEGATAAGSTSLTFGIRPPSEFAGVRIGRILDAAGWPAADRTLDVGQTLMQGGEVVGDALSLIQNVAVNTELGQFFIGGDGKATFYDRHRRFKSPYTTPQGVFGDGGGAELGYTMIGGDYDVTTIKNRALITRVGGIEQVAEDATSKLRYFKRTESRSGLLMTTDSEASDMAYFFVSKYKDPALRFPGISVKPEGAAATLYPQALGRELGDRITVRVRPGTTAPAAIVRSGTLTNGSYTVTGLASTSDLRAGMIVSGTGITTGTMVASVDSGSQITLDAVATTGGAQSLSFQQYIEADQHVESVSHAWSPAEWETTWDLSTADTNSYWVLGDSVNGVLGVTTKLAY